MAFGPENIDPFMCTHLIYSFTGLEGNKMVTLDNEADVVQGGYQKALDLKKVNPDLKVLLKVFKYYKKYILLCFHILGNDCYWRLERRCQKVLPNGIQ